MVVQLELNSTDAKDRAELREVALKISKSRKIIAITGAGISSDAGIPDFRSKDGLYNMVKHQHPTAVVKGQDLFDAVLFSSPTSISVFFTFMSSLRKCIRKAQPTDTHKFLSRLKANGRLLRCYTQNIDGLEGKLERSLSIGVDPKSRPDVIQLHGNIEELKCMHCAYLCDWSEEQVKLCDIGEAPTCPACRKVQQERLQAGKRDRGAGSLRPNIVLYGEDHPDGDKIGRCTMTDLRSNPDCLVIMGTSLKVVGIRKLARTMAKAVKARGGIVVYVNATEPQSIWNGVIDIHVKGNCDEWVRSLKQEHIPNFFCDQATLDFKVSKQQAISPPITPKKHKQPMIIPTTLPPTPRSVEPMKLSQPMRSPLRAITNRNFQCLSPLQSSKKRKLHDDTPSVPIPGFTIKRKCF